MPVSYKNKLFTLALVLLVALFAVISAWLMHILFQKCLFKKGA